jgi:hypothetical protein
MQNEIQNEQLTTTAGGSEPTSRPSERTVWPVADVQRARDYLIGALASKSVLTIQELELLADLDAEVASRTGARPRALDELQFATRLLQTRREKQIALVRRGRAQRREASA